jgi:hypothetical protein
MSGPEREGQKACANPRCLNGANCPGHPWREDELEQLRFIEGSSRDMNVAGYRGAGFRQGANFYRPQISRARAALAACEDTGRPDVTIHAIHKQRGVNDYLFRCECGLRDMARLEAVDHIANASVMRDTEREPEHA